MLKYRPNARFEEGIKTFTGDPADFKHWQFQTELKAQLARSEESKAPKYVQEIMERLGGEALQLARDMGVRELCKTNGIDELLKRMQKLVFPTFKQEASQLYAIGHQNGGILSRQHNEPMTSYIERRTQWWKPVQDQTKLEETNC